jgi:hypothetical protein
MLKIIEAFIDIDGPCDEIWEFHIDAIERAYRIRREMIEGADFSQLLSQCQELIMKLNKMIKTMTRACFGRADESIKPTWYVINGNAVESTGEGFDMLFPGCSCGDPDNHQQQSKFAESIFPGGKINELTPRKKSENDK